MLRLLGADQIIALHDDILLTTGIGLPGLAPDKDIHGMLARVENRIRYGLVRRNDLLYVGAFYA
ncbi:MAG TPA: hypothetical protein VM555_09370, partial [Tahibacter sp.]|nr:hypothetical protein [Tahibacter sp.]